MTQTFHISDALRCILLNAPRGPNLVCAQSVCSANKAPLNVSLWKNVLTQRRNRLTAVQWKGMQLDGLVSAKLRAGRRAWEIDHLYLPLDSASTLINDGDFSQSLPLQSRSAHLELLEQAVQNVGTRLGERIFLRLPQYSPIATLVRRVGFFPYYEGTVMEGMWGMTSPGHATVPEGLHDLKQGDAFALFQLFSATTPATIREALGVTFDHWQDAQEIPIGKGQQWVMEHQGHITGWLRLVPKGVSYEGEMMVHPDHPDLLPALLRMALTQTGIGRWLVPDYQGRLARHLEDSGFHKLAKYTMHIKTVAAPVTRPGMAPVEA